VGVYANYWGKRKNKKNLRSRHWVTETTPTRGSRTGTQPPKENLKIWTQTHTPNSKFHQFKIPPLNW